MFFLLSLLKNITDSELVKRIIGNDSKSFEELYNRYSSYLYGVIFRVVKVEEIAEDVLQEAFVKIWRSMKSFDESKSKLSTWLLNICRNLAIDKIRSKEYKNYKQNQDIDISVNIIEDNMNYQINPDTIGVKDMLGKLPDEHRKLIDLFYFEGLTQKDVAEKLGIPIGTVKTRMRAAVNNLRKIFN